DELKTVSDGSKLSLDKSAEAEFVKDPAVAIRKQQRAKQCAQAKNVAGRVSLVGILLLGLVVVGGVTQSLLAASPQPLPSPQGRYSPTHDSFAVCMRNSTAGRVLPQAASMT